MEIVEIVTIENVDIQLLGLIMGVPVIVYALPFLLSLGIRGIFKIMDS